MPKLHLTSSNLGVPFILIYPCQGAFLMYHRILITTSQWSVWDCINWLAIPTAEENVRYNNCEIDEFPTQPPISLMIEIRFCLNRHQFRSLGLLMGLQSNTSISLCRSLIHTAFVKWIFHPLIEPLQYQRSILISQGLCFGSGWPSALSIEKYRISIAMASSRSKTSSTPSIIDLNKD